MKVTPLDSSGNNGPKASTSSRPESVIERFNIAKHDDSGHQGISIGGIFISANCNIILLVMAGIFLVVGKKIIIFS